ncbi:uncharacterized protein LOC128034792 [Gossypium raimondii]|uniref:uncharacterized protein LOC128034792 n=1 Tax=Gossypium raimondii TaxID=29730 RepID=UPI00227A3E32|nr:uncharacterized protein LOC128034792 [Gossypium raimondii]
MIEERWNYLSNVISILVAEKLVRKGCEVFLAYVSVSDSRDSIIKDIRTEKNVPDVFPDELSGLPLNHEVEFRIELLPGTAPVSITPYRMALKELVELKSEPGNELIVYSDASHIKSKQLEDEPLGLRFWQIKGSTTDFGLNSDGVLYFCGRICVPNGTDLRQAILREAYSSPYVMHLGENKMYIDLRELYWWPSLKQEVTEFVAKCWTCQQVKAEHQLPSSLLQPVKILL